MTDLTPEERLILAHDETLRNHLKASRGALNGALSDLDYTLNDLSDPVKRAKYVRHWQEVTLERLRKATAEFHKAVEAALKQLEA